MALSAPVAIAPTDDPLVGTLIDNRYLVRRRIGAGGMGVVYEAQHVLIERSVALAGYDQIGVDDLPEKIRDHRPAQVELLSPGASELVSLEEIERRYILHALDVLAGNKALAAQILGMDRRTLYRKLERYGQGS